MVYDIKNKLKQYFPIFFELLGTDTLDWRTIEKRFSEKLDEHKKKFDLTGQPVRVEASLYHIITASREGNDEALRLLNFIIKLFEELIVHLNEAEKTLIKNNLFGLLTNVDMKYLNFFGELCVLNQVKRDDRFRLIATEEPLDANNKAGTKIDFAFSNADSERKYLVEVVNIHINEHVTSTDDKIERLLNQKIRGKLIRKGIESLNEFILIPVVWGPIADIKRLIRYYETFHPKFPKASTPVCFMSFTNGNGNRIYRFGSIDTILK